jgi:hypothetical protein
MGIISSDFWKMFSLEDFLSETLGNLLCFWDSVELSFDDLNVVSGHNSTILKNKYIFLFGVGMVYF